MCINERAYTPSWEKEEGWRCARSIATGLHTGRNALQCSCSNGPRVQVPSRSGDKSAVAKLPDSRAAESKHLGEDLVGVLSESRGGADRLPLVAPELQR